MQDELDADSLLLDVVISGVNGIGHESGIPSMCLGRDITLLQDVDAAKVWESWQVTYRDVFVLDEENKVVTIYNLTAHDLADSVNYGTLKTILRQTAGIPSR